MGVPLLSKHVKHVPKHRGSAEPRLSRAPRQALRTTALLSGVAVATTGAAIASGVVHEPPAVSATVTAATGDVGSVADARLSGATTTDVRTDPADRTDADSADRGGLGDLGDRAEPASRSSDRREQADPAKQATLTQGMGRGATQAITRSQDLSEADPRDIARAMLPEFGFGADQFSCLDSLWVSESDWRIDADNPTSSAYGIPQALTQLHDLPADYMTSAASQIRWGLGYIRDAYGSPCNAWSFKQGHNWY
ncbi:lytic transglycosylase domain-containing protein [Nocardioides marmotae]|uniref:aggregation-promoting factor C-terminal-like domain-containing protein n=1 Tax=Nocardioides marmotae TaxID=2663857 RepID=UPI00293505CA|nr:lytic transglycosylase domain-containing protein [Nocardioides marmotae]